MRQLRWLFPIAVLLPCRLHAWDDTVRARVVTLASSGQCGRTAWPWGYQTNPFDGRKCHRPSTL
jgi:hypothetical protein